MLNMALWLRAKLLRQFQTVFDDGVSSIKYFPKTTCKDFHNVMPNIT
jgi:hypothetical protein